MSFLAVYFCLHFDGMESQSVGQFDLEIYLCRALDPMESLALTLAPFWISNRNNAGRPLLACNLNG